MRGFGNQAALKYLKSMIRMHKPSIVCILEPKQHHSKISEYASKINFPCFLTGEPLNTHIWLFWTMDIDLALVEVAEQHITITIRGDQPIRCSFVYAQCLRSERLSLWEQIQNLSENDVPWLVSGDFNVILRASEKRGGLPPDPDSMHEFQECMMRSNLSELNYEGNEFTWCNNQRGRRRIWQLLDRVFGNGAAFIRFPNLKVRHLHRLTSDHSPLLLFIKKDNPYRSRFIFQRM